MAYSNKDKKMVERPEDEPPYNRNNPTDRRIVGMLLGIAAFMLVAAIVFITLYYVL